MKTFPMFLKTTGRRIVILGGGEQAAQKCRLALKTDAEIVIAAPELEPELASLAAEGRVRRAAAATPDALFEGAVLVFTATGCRGADAALAARARAAGALVNVVDAPEICDAFTPSLVDRDPLVVAIGTEGAAPVLARQVKTRIEELLEPRLGAFAALAGRLRAAAAARVPPERRRAFWRWAFSGPARRAHALGREREAARVLKSAIAAGGAPAVCDGAREAAGVISLVGAGPGARDLMTLRGVQRLQEADMIFCDRVVDPDVLELARRDAERVVLGRPPGAAAWPAARTAELAVAAARRGARVVWLTRGAAPRDGETLAALGASGVAIEVVPGVADDDEAAPLRAPY